jgi:hypothetical protein
MHPLPFSPSGLPLYYMTDPASDYLPRCYDDATLVNGRNLSLQCPDATFTPTQGWNVSAIVVPSYPVTNETLAPFNSSSVRRANRSDFVGLNFAHDCRNAARGPAYGPFFPEAYCHCANQCYADDELEISRIAYSYASFSLGAYYCIMMIFSFVLIRERGMPRRTPRRMPRRTPRRSTANGKRGVGGEGSLKADEDDAVARGDEAQGERLSEVGRVLHPDLIKQGFEAHLSEETKRNLLLLSQASRRDLAVEGSKIHEEGADITQRQKTPLVTGLLNTLNNR